VKYIFRKKINIFFVSIFDAAGYFFKSLAGKKKNLRKPDFKTVLVVRLDHLGDVLSATSLPKILKENFAGCRVLFLTSSLGAELLSNNPFVDRVLVYDAPWFFRRRHKKNRAGLSFFSLVSELKKSGVDLALGLRGDLRENILFFLAGIDNRWSYGVTGGGFLLTKELIYRKLAHESERLKELLRELGIKMEELTPQIYLSDEETGAFKSRMPELGLSALEKYVGVQIDAGTPAKEWPFEHEKLFLNEFVKRFPSRKIVLIGSNKDRATVLWDGKREIVNLAGKITIRELCILMRYLDFFVGFDSGPSHIAAALGVPTLFLYSGTNRFEQWKPVMENSLVLRHPVPCSPCHLEVCNVKGHPCMAQIKPEEAIRALEQFLGDGVR